LRTGPRHVHQVHQSCRRGDRNASSGDGPLPALSKDEKTADECSKYITEMFKDLDNLEALVPNVPPEEASYIEKEYSAATASGAGKRIDDIEHRLFFPAWNLHNSFNDAREQLKLSRPIGSDVKFTIQMASRIPYRMANAKIAWDKFDSADGGKILTLQQIRLGAEKSEHMIGAAGLYIGCLASFIQDSK
jgi:hypothetical protein